VGGNRKALTGPEGTICELNARGSGQKKKKQKKGRPGGVYNAEGKGGVTAPDKSGFRSAGGTSLHGAADTTLISGWDEPNGRGERGSSKRRKTTETKLATGHARPWRSRETDAHKERGGIA